jgi:hypothetical protein
MAPEALPSGACLSALTSARGVRAAFASMIHRIIAGRLESLTSALERSIRSLTPRAFASEVFYAALASAKGRPPRSCLDDLSRHSRPLPIVDIRDRAFDQKQGNAIEKQRDVLSTFHRFSTAIRSTASMILCSREVSCVKVHRCVGRSLLKSRV